MRARLVWTTALLTTAILAGCLGGGGDDGGGGDGDGKTTSVFERATLPFNVTDPVMSHTLEPGPYGILPGVQYFAPVELPPEEGAPAATGVQVSIGVHFPDIPGCDFTADAVPDECRVPVIADVGPYYRSADSVRNQLPQACTPVIDIVCTQEGEPDAPVFDHTNMRLMGTLVTNFVPHGYAVAAVSVLGTGDSGHCMDLMGHAEQAGVQAAVEHMGSSAWSNGAVALTGRSYDGSTPWEAAMAGSPYLRTIVPISGLQGQHDLMWRNGSAELRGPGVLYALYAMYTQDGGVEDAQNALCPDYLVGGPEGVLSYAFGGSSTDAAYPYWQERYFFDDVMENYEGSVYYIHGLQDWNVDNHQAFPYYNQLLGKGLEMKGLFGQWAHHYPDRLNEHQNLPSGRGGEASHNSVRYDWAQDLLEWFDHYLKGTGPKPDLHVEVQDNMGDWRVEADYPPQDATVLDLAFADAEVVQTAPGGAQPTGPTVGPRHRLELTFPPLSEDQDTRIAGNVRMPVQVTPNGPGGQIGATLYDAESSLRLGHAIMDLRYHAGGKEMQTVTPGAPIVAQMEFFALDAVVPAGHGLRVVLTDTVEDYLPSDTTNPVVVDLDASVLRVPTVERAPDVFFAPPQPAEE